MEPRARAALVIRDLLIAEIIPNDPLFSITEEQINAFIRIYDTYSIDKGTKTYRHRINFTFARKMAGRDLLKFKQELGAKANQCKEGFIYTVGNPAWPNYLKIGMSTNVDKRIAAYQTYSPLRDYFRLHYEFVLNKREFEKKILNKFGTTLGNGEWIENAKVDNIIAFVNSQIPRKPSWI